VRGDRVFRYDTRRRMTEVHLFFVKLFGGMILEGGDGRIPIRDATKTRSLVLYGGGRSVRWISQGLQLSGKRPAQLNAGSDASALGLSTAAAGWTP
jgi:hypothetical protein